MAGSAAYAVAPNAATADAVSLDIVSNPADACTTPDDSKNGRFSNKRSLHFDFFNQLLMTFKCAFEAADFDKVVNSIPVAFSVRTTT